MFTSIARRVRRLLHRHVVVPQIDRALRTGNFVLYRYAPEMDRLLAYSSSDRSLFRSTSVIPSDDWYTVLRDRNLRMAVALDIGANIGYTAAWFSAWADRVYAFEPNPDNIVRIREQLMIRHLDNVEVIESAVADTEGDATLFVKPVSGHHSLDDIGASETLHEISVSVTTLDRFCAERGITQVGLVKIDVEGFEPDVLRGGAGLLRARAIDLILFEYSPAFYRARDLDPRAPIDVLQEAGYRVSHLDGTPIDYAVIDRSAQTDLLASPADCAAS